MVKKNNKAKLNRTLAASTVLSTLSALAVGQVQAQSELHPEPNDTKLEEVYVTGSHIRRPSLEALVPSTALDNEFLKLSGSNHISDILFQLPAAGIPGVSQTNSNSTSFATGIATINLRNLGTTRTLILVNGRRHVGGDSENANVVDLNSIPSAFIERIEVVTGGASAIYGSEALAGVVNIITKDKMDGIRVNLQGGISADGDGEDDSISVTGGTSFAGGRGESMLHLGYTRLGGIASRDRALSAFDDFLGDFQDFSSFAPQGGVFTQDGNFITQAPDGSWTEPFDARLHGFNRNQYRMLSVPLTRKEANLNLTYQLDNDIDFFIESAYVQSESFSHREPTIIGQFLSVGRDGPDLSIPSDNSFIPDEILATWVDAGETLPESLTFRKRFTELGTQDSDQTRDTTRIAIGLEGETRGWQWDTYYQWGRNKRRQNNQGVFNTLFFQNTLDIEVDPSAANGFQCRDASARAAGCVPIDIFGVNSINQEAIDYVSVTTQNQSTIEQHVAAAKIGGELFSIGTAPATQVVIGAEWRKEELETQADPLATTGFTSGNTSAPVKGSFDVNEFFVELDVPLLNQAPFAKHLGLNMAYRIADYSTFGHLDSWKLGFNWMPIKDLRVRSVLSESVRAPNINELFDPGGETFESFIDPCANGGASRQGSTAANCASLGITSDFDPSSVGSSAGGFVSGNINLSEETADTSTLGFVYTPSWLDGASLSIDYFSIEIDDAIELIDPQVKLNECYAASDFPSNIFCNGIVREDADLGFLVSRLDFTLENIGKFKTSGYDFELNYGFALRGGKIAWRTLITKTNDWQQQVFDAVISDYEEPGFQEWKGSNRISYHHGQWSGAWSTRYIGSGVVDNDFNTEIWPDNDNLNEEFYHDIYLNYAFNKNNAFTYDIYAGINNLTDNDPPYIPTPSVNADTGTGTAAAVYDVIGRFAYAGVTLHF